jgi:hypothetical protein
MHVKWPASRQKPLKLRDYVVHKQLVVEFAALRQTRRRAQRQATEFQCFAQFAPAPTRALLVAARAANQQ